MYTLLATGDLMLQRPLARAEDAGLGTVYEALRSADHAFANLEVALTMQSGSVDKLVCLRADPSLAASLARAGIKVVTLANNHAADRWDSLRGELNRCGGIACVVWNNPEDGPDGVELWPLWLDDAGEPAFPGVERAQAAITRVAEQSQELGTSVRPVETPRGIVGVVEGGFRRA